ncbi:MAG: bifunctional methionine sulfoxide reductase B/A protein [Bacteroidales bacterium]|nr:bifunctional methionine sulfoxide reductase B/A protein [Bacteroidales bacterium]NLK82342.1 bifunctional methionine sulfoxide reductase B/A protein [Bacteroidales bacterium]
MQKKRKLLPYEEYVIIHKGTEKPFSGVYTNHFDAGIYCCKQCEQHLFRSSDKFHSSCGWPSFDDAIEHALALVPDADGKRTEIVCSSCGGHLGHVFYGEGFTEKQTRHCVNSVSLDFIPYQIAYFASGCFWGTEYWFSQVPGVIQTCAGYTGGSLHNPSYEQVCTGLTGHAEAVEVIFDENKVSYNDLMRLFFNTHDPTQLNQQGPDIGEQYRSEIFYVNEEQKQSAEACISTLLKKGIEVVTKCEKFDTFYPAEEIHQSYYQKHAKKPYCHIFRELC